jgi:hypothetical protein
MADATVSSVNRHSVGDMTMHIVDFSSIADTNTYASGLPNVLGHWANDATNVVTLGDEGINVAESSGTFTFYVKTTTTDAKLYILSLT